jgi:hypothetical protein
MYVASNPFPRKQRPEGMSAKVVLELWKENAIKFLQRTVVYNAMPAHWRRTLVFTTTDVFSTPTFLDEIKCRLNVVCRSIKAEAQAQAKAKAKAQGAETDSSRNIFSPVPDKDILDQNESDWNALCVKFIAYVERVHRTKLDFDDLVGLKRIVESGMPTQYNTDTSFMPFQVSLII